MIQARWAWIMPVHSYLIEMSRVDYKNPFVPFSPREEEQTEQDDVDWAGISNQVDGPRGLPVSRGRPENAVVIAEPYLCQCTEIEGFERGPWYIELEGIARPWLLAAWARLLTIGGSQFHASLANKDFFSFMLAEQSARRSPALEEIATVQGQYRSFLLDSDRGRPDHIRVRLHTRAYNQPWDRETPPREGTWYELVLRELPPIAEPEDGQGWSTIEPEGWSTVAHQNDDDLRFGEEAPCHIAEIREVEDHSEDEHEITQAVLQLLHTPVLPP